MGSYILAGSEYFSTDPREKTLVDRLTTLQGQKGTFSLKIDQHRTIWKGTCVVGEIHRREERIEEGHLTIEQVAFQLLPLEADCLHWELLFPIEKFVSYEEYGRHKIFRFSTFSWMWHNA
ncbi:hypothetical protein [Heliorestis convoluta]|uniref:Uncharacterized protein n=1 Tax=Heliorestis convoluta TaxID=356322 RepID=A0A5Q2MZK6_9FIRM|nr:hypothetical protein [Heliorestis convoluta]QGG46883.1 hypothetical protein FTV88_0705 [Heliorestis convoluta]